MFFLKKLFRKKEIEIEENTDWEEIIYAKDQINFHDEEQRSRYIMNCLEQMGEAEKEMQLLTAEYGRVTSYLCDMEEIESLPESEKKELVAIAKALLSLEDDKKKYHGRKSRMPDAVFYQMRAKESEIEEGLEKLKEAEAHRDLIKQDLRRLDKERYAYSYRKSEAENACQNYRGMAFIFVCATAVCLFLLALMQFVFEIEAMVGFLIAVLAGALAITWVCIKNMDASKEADKLMRDINKLIQLQNKVKIRYVNNTNLLDYLYIKYNTDSAEKLGKRWRVYKKEKEERAGFVETEDKLEQYGKQLMGRLSRYHVKDPGRWMHQVNALIDSREMVEVRHELILRRQALRKQLEYNKNVSSTAHEEIMEIMKTYPKYAAEIKSMMEKHKV